MRETFIVGAARTPIGKFGGALVALSPVEMGAQVMQAALARAGVQGSDLDLYIFGNILKHGHGQLLPRHAALKAGIPETVDGYAVDMLCSSGMMAVMNADQAIRAGEADVVLAGGIESMSQAGFMMSYQARWGYKLLTGDQGKLADVLLDDGLRDPTTQELMGEESERLARLHQVSRTELDEVACRSHARAAAAAASGKLAQEIAPVTVGQGRKQTTVNADEGIRPDTNPATLATLPPAFAKDGVLTAGNSSQLSDGAAALVLASGEAVQRLGLRPLARLLGGAWAAVTPWRFVEGPIPAIRKLLRRLGMQLEDFDLFENNEAFALNNVLLRRELEIDDEQVNVYGGAIALGHPIGASGARIIVTLLNALQQEEKRRGIAALCHGLGGGTALAVERVYG
ncbi:MAG TPA: thiolase family protein [Caldilineaceae bacterium]|nr:thiolase family protein [Caldilineaceae bacterium]